LALLLQGLGLLFFAGEFGLFCALGVVLLGDQRGIAVGCGGPL
jgi:hypothetical protein